MKSTYAIIVSIGVLAQLTSFADEAIRSKIQFALWGSSIESITNAAGETQSLGTARKLYFYNGNRVDKVQLDGSGSQMVFEYSGPTTIHFYPSHPGDNPAEPNVASIIKSPNLQNSSHWLFILRVIVNETRVGLLPIDMDHSTGDSSLGVLNSSSKDLTMQIGSEVHNFTAKTRRFLDLNKLEEGRRHTVKIAGFFDGQPRLLDSFYLPRTTPDKMCLFIAYDLDETSIDTKLFQIAIQ